MDKIKVIRREVTVNEQSALWNYVPIETYGKTFNLVNGVDVSNHHGPYFIVTGTEVKLEKKVVRILITHYVNEAGATLPKEDYDQTRVQLYNDGNWADLDAEYAFKKFVKEWQKVEVEDVTIDEIPHEIILVDAGNLPPYTTQHFTSPIEYNKRNIARCDYSPKPIELITAAAKKHGFEYVEYKYSVDTKGRKWTVGSTLDYFKVNDRYVDMWPKGYYWGCIGTAEECRRKHEANLKMLEEGWTKEESFLVPTLPSKKTLGDFALDLQIIQNKLRNVSVKQASLDAYNDLKQFILALQNKIAQDLKS